MWICIRYTVPELNCRNKDSGKVGTLNFLNFYLIIVYTRTTCKYENIFKTKSVVLFKFNVICN